jgi:hypothetical protein
VAVAAVLVALGLSAQPAQAQIGPGAYGLGFFNYGTYDSYYRVPYYSLFPPVYYSYPVARPYGYSPFAYPPGTMTPEIQQQTAAVEYRNPFVPQQPKQASQDKTASAPRMYYNPYVKQASTASTAASAADGS